LKEILVALYAKVQNVSIEEAQKVYLRELERRLKEVQSHSNSDPAS
jgi:helix-turn-helix protein